MAKPFSKNKVKLVHLGTQFSNTSRHSCPALSLASKPDPGASFIELQNLNYLRATATAER